MKFRGLLSITTAMALGVLTGMSTAMAAPQNPTVTSGSATITQSGNHLNIVETSKSATINWSSFSLAPGEVIQFFQPNAQSSILNRVTGNSASFLNGSLLANGVVYLVNPNGINIGRLGNINVGSFIATTSNITDANFMAGKYVFTNAPDGSAITNQGNITAAEGGTVILSAARVDNQGTIVARQGNVALGAAKGFVVDTVGDGLLLYQVGDATASALVSNSGSVSATGGKVQFSARSIDTVARDVINTTGLVEANSVSVNNGEVVFDGGTQGIVSVGGQVQASGKNAGETGGKVQISGNQVAIANAALIDTSGQAGGGNINVGTWDSANTSVASSSTLNASSIFNGNGGYIGVFGGQTLVSGVLLANGGAFGGDGGSVETSGHTLGLHGVSVDVGSPKGKAGNWLLDPYDLTVDSTLATSIDTALASGNVTLQTSSGSSTQTCNGSTCSGGTSSSSGSGDININNAISWSSNNTLTLNAYRDININANITASGNSATLAMLYGQGTTGYDLTASGSSVTMSGTSPTLSINGNSYTLLSTAAQVQSMGTSGHYALANDISLSSIANFSPIGYSSGSFNLSPTAFTGTLDGLGHTLSSLTISDTTHGNIGLISYITSGSVLNTALTSATITGGSTSLYNDVGVLAGKMSSGSIINSSTSGSVTTSGSGNVGGLVGYTTGGTIYLDSSTATVGNGTGSYAGGLIGSSSSTISYSYATGSVSGGTYIGGLAGGSSGNVSNSYSTGDASGARVGGLIGANTSIISDSFASGNVSGTTYVGGLAGSSSGNITSSYAAGAVVSNGGSLCDVGGLVGYSSSAIVSSYATGSVSGSSGSSYFGGLVGVGSGGSITNSYSVGSVSTTGGSNTIGGLVPSSVGGTVTTSYWDTTTSGQSSGSGTGLTDTQMKSSSNYSGWSFGSTWYMSTYPILLASPFVLSAAIANESMTYGASLPTLSATYSGYFGTDTSSVISGSPTTTATSTSSVGSYSIVGSGLSATSSTGHAYTIVSTDGTLTISTAPLTVTASSPSKTYGTTASLSTDFTTSGLLNSDTVTSVTNTSSGSAATASAGSYSIVPSAASGSGLSNYTITYANGTLTVNTAPLTVTANSTSKTYGSAATLASTDFTTSGLLNSDTVTSVTNTSSGSAATASAGSYSIVPSAASGSGLSNYTITYATGP